MSEFNNVHIAKLKVGRGVGVGSHKRITFLKNLWGCPLELCLVQGGLKCFNLKSHLCGHFEIISFLELRISFGLERAMCVFSDKHTSQ